jgi:hypothetical protein
VSGAAGRRIALTRLRRKFAPVDGPTGFSTTRRIDISVASLETPDIFVDRPTRRSSQPGAFDLPGCGDRTFMSLAAHAIDILVG